MLGDRGEHQLLEYTRDASIRVDRGGMRDAAGNSMRYRAETDLPGLSGVVHRLEDRVAAHSTRKSDAERTSVELQRVYAGAVLEGGLVRVNV